jgi:hypothetical protein
MMASEIDITTKRWLVSNASSSFARPEFQQSRKKRKKLRVNSEQFVAGRAMTEGNKIKHGHFKKANYICLRIVF